MFLIDTHTHLYLDDFKEDIDLLIDSARKKNIKKFLLPNIDIHTLKPLLRLTELYPNNCFPMIGLHPCSVDENFQNNLKILESKISKNNFIGIGEIGIDLHWDQTFFQEQKKAFEIQINWAKKYNLPIVIHSRKSFNEIYQILKKLQSGNLKGVFHCFGGTIEEAKKIIDLGFLLGIGGVVTFKNSSLDQVLKKIPLNHILIETDAPYLAPYPYRGKRNKPEFLNIIANKICEIKNISLSELTNNLYLNTNSLFFNEK
tara:strand:+ start:253 stop:1026 length:774 start_codon:yes stop_codon:yes gene_type:complete